IEGPVLVVDRAVIEAGRLNDPRDTARGELLEAGPERRPPFAHGPANAVVFHGSLQVRAERSSILTSDPGSTTGRKRQLPGEIPAGLIRPACALCRLHGELRMNCTGGNPSYL